MLDFIKGFINQTKTRNQSTIAIYRLVTLIIGLGLVILVLSRNDFVIDPFILVGIGIAEGLGITIILCYVVGRNRNAGIIILLAIDVIFCLFLVIYSGAINSPFILYSLSPVLTTALIHNKKTTSIIASILAGGVIISHIFNPFYAYVLSPLSVSSITIFIVAVGLVGILPFLINANLKQRLEEDQARQERLRLSREIHDGVAQTLITLSWQFQLMRRNFVNNKFDIEELKKLEKMAQQATRDIRESIEVLRDYESHGNFVFLLKGLLEEWKKESNVEYTLGTFENNIKINGKTEAETVKVLKEALVNIKKHSGATHVQINLNKFDHQLQIDIVDNGRGFEYSDLSANNPKLKGHYGLTVMRERMKSVNGDIRITSQPGKGTEIKIIVPLKTKEE